MMRNNLRVDSHFNWIEVKDYLARPDHSIPIEDVEEAREHEVARVHVHHLNGSQ